MHPGVALWIRLQLHVVGCVHFIVTNLTEISYSHDVGDV